MAASPNLRLHLRSSASSGSDLAVFSRSEPSASGDVWGRRLSLPWLSSTSETPRPTAVDRTMSGTSTPPAFAPPPAPPPRMSQQAAAGGVPAAVMVRNAVVLFFIGMAILLALVALTYCVSYVIDRFCCGAAALRALHNDERRVVEGGTVARDAGLSGLTGPERRLVLEAVLTCKPYSTEEVARIRGRGVDEERAIAAAGSVIAAADDGNRDDLNNRSGDGKVERAPSLSSSSLSTEVGGADSHDIQDDITCAICLNEYEENEQVVTGRRCTHLFHRDCLLEWLDRGHDACPTCREDVMTSDEMRDAAVKVFGREGATEIFMRNPFAPRSSGPPETPTPSPPSLPLPPQAPSHHRVDVESGS